nr:nascent polypeptide-associated complex subunit alpha, muscle-specific form-like [Equus asinus]
MVTPRPYSRHSTGLARGNSHLHSDWGPDPHPTEVHLGPPGLGARLGLRRGDPSCPLAPHPSPAGQVPGSREGKGRNSGSDTKRREALRGVPGGAPLQPREGPSQPDPAQARHRQPGGGRTARALAKAPSPAGAPGSRSAEKGKVLARGRGPRTPAATNPRPRVPSARPPPAARPVPEAEIDPRGPPRPPSARRQGGEERGGPAGRAARGRALAPPAHRPSPGLPRVVPAAGRGTCGADPWGQQRCLDCGGWAARRGGERGRPPRTVPLPRLPAPRGGPASGKLRGARGGVRRGPLLPSGGQPATRAYNTWDFAGGGIGKGRPPGRPGRGLRNMPTLCS